MVRSCLCGTLLVILTLSGCDSAVGPPPPVDVPPPTDEPDPIDDPGPIEQPDPIDDPDPCTASADANGDGVVDQADYQVWHEHNGDAPAHGSAPSNGDFNRDGHVDRLDYVVWATQRVAKQTWYVSADGSDSNPGSENAPWRTIRRAAVMAEAGDRVLIAPGVYTTPVTVKKSGSEDAPISLVGTGPGVILDGSSDGSNEGFSAHDKSHIHLQRLTMRNWFKEGIAMYDVVGLALVDVEVQNCGHRRHKWDHGIGLERNRDFVLQGVKALGNYANGIYVLDSDGGLITSCTANNNNGTGESDGILVQNARHIRVESCSAASNGEDGIDIGGFEQQAGRDTYDVEVVHCTAHDNADDGFAVSGTNGSEFETHDVTVSDCQSQENGGAGIQVYQQAYNVLLKSCKFVRNKRGLNFHSSPHDVQVLGCVITGNRAENLSIDSSVQRLTMKDNVTE